MEGIDWETVPPLLGYNKIQLKKSATLLATVGDGDVLMAAGDYFSGRNFVFASDPSPHWGINFMSWKYYNTLWVQVVKWLAKAL